MLTKNLKARFQRLEQDDFRRKCPICGKEIDPDDEDSEYVYTKRKSHIFFHRGCVKDWGKTSCGLF